MGIGAADAQAGTGGIDGDTQNLVQFETPDTGDDAKVTYFTPRIIGFQLGASFVPDNNTGISDSNNTAINPKAPRRTSSAPASTGRRARSVRPDRCCHRHQGSAIGSGDDLKSWDAGVLFRLWRVHARRQRLREYRRQ